MFAVGHVSSADLSKFRRIEPQFIATLNGRDVTGVDGLSDYSKSQEAQVLKTFSQKLLGYALGRTMLASDQPLIDKLVTAGGEARFSSLISEIVASRQFRQRREEREESGH